MKLIPLIGKNGQGKFAKVDDEDFEYLSQWKWRIQKTKIVDKFYAVRTLKNTKVIIKMDNQLLGNKKNHVIDHINNDGLDNQRNNLRFATYSQNSANREGYSNSSSEYIGVSKRKIGKYIYWRVQIKVKGRFVFTKNFPFTPEGEIEAAKVRDSQAIKYFKEFVKLNFVN